MVAVPSNGNCVLLNSWKEIANHLGRGVRTVQRWEHDLGLPVRRPWGRSRSTVVAMSDELDAWMRTAPRSEVARKEKRAALFDNRKSRIIELQQSIGHAHELRLRAEQLRLEHNSTLQVLLGNVAELQAQARQSKNRNGKP